jgi:ABC-2 type transport system permease protein
MTTETMTATTDSTPNKKTIRPFYWSVRREIWENRSLYLAPLIVAGVIIIGFMFTAVGLAERRRAILLIDDAARQRAAIEMPYSMAAMMIMFTAFIVGVFYCLDALHGERRDRSILFWKSLPVSDLTTVLSKITIPLAVLPAISFAVIIVTQLVILLITSAVLIAHGMSPLTTLAHTNLPQNTLILVYGLIAVSLWHAPTYGWMMLVSAWARRAAFLWALLPAVAISFFEKIVFGTNRFADFLKYRFMNWADDAFAFRRNAHGQPLLDSLSQLTPGRYLTTPGLWLGLIFAVVCLAIAIRLRRYRGPI